MQLALSYSPTLDCTHLANQLAQQHGLSIIEDPTRGAVEALGFQTLYEIPIQAQLELREQLLVEHLGVLKHNTAHLYYFSLFNWLADWMRWAWAHTTTEQWERIYTYAEQAAALYDTVYHVTHAPPRSYDGYAWLDQRNGEQIARLLPHLHAEFGVKAEVLTGE